MKGEEMGESLPRVTPEWANVSKLDVVILSSNSSPSLSPRWTKF